MDCYPRGGFLMIELFLKGGPIMFLLLGCSLLLTYISINKYLFFRQEFVSHAVALNMIKLQLNSLGKGKTIEWLSQNKRLMFRMISIAIADVDSQQWDREARIKSALGSQVETMEKYMPLLSAIITISPILGLMGTVLGIMDIFNVISGDIFGAPEQLSKGISEALITTVSGLAIMIPGVVFFQFIRHKINMTILKIELISNTAADMIIDSNPNQH
jgi:biopolymer transport protein ExbB